MRRSPALAVLTALVMVTTAACGGADESGSPTTSTEVGSTTTRAGGRGTTTSVGPPRCPPVEVGADADEVVEKSGDVDGDGALDVLRSFRIDDAWHLQVELAVGGGGEMVLPAFGAAPMAVIGGADVDGDGADEVWSVVGSGAATTIVGLARLRGCTLEQVKLPTGEPAELAVGGSVGTTSGLHCEGGGTGAAPAADGADLSSYSASSVDGASYEGIVTAYRLEETTLVPGPSRPEQVDAAAPEFQLYTSFSCADLAL